MTTQFGRTSTVELVLGLPRDADRPSVSRSALAFIGRWIASAREELRVRKAMAELDALDDRLLRDIGITRCGIEYVVRATIDARRI